MTIIGTDPDAPPVAIKHEVTIEAGVPMPVGERWHNVMITEAQREAILLRLTGIRYDLDCGLADAAPLMRELAGIIIDMLLNLKPLADVDP